MDEIVSQQQQQQQEQPYPSSIHSPPELALRFVFGCCCG
jgi:hypothetical protein